MALVSRRAMTTSGQPCANPAATQPAASEPRLVIEPFDVRRVKPGAYVALPGEPFALVVEVMSGAWTSPGTRIWLDYGTRIGLYVASKSAPLVGEPTAKMILPAAADPR